MVPYRVSSGNPLRGDQSEFPNTETTSKKYKIMFQLFQLTDDIDMMTASATPKMDSQVTRNNGGLNGYASNLIVKSDTSLLKNEDVIAWPK